MHAGEEHDLTPDDGAPAAARAIVRRTLASHARVDDAALIASELVTNAVRHGRAPVRLAIASDGHAVRITVSQRAGTSRPQRLALDPSRPGGQGLRIVDALADAWGWDETDDEITVWALLA